MSSLQLGLIVAGVALVVGVLIYNWLQERRVRRRIREAFHEAGAPASAPPRVAAGRGAERVEPTLGQLDAAAAPPPRPAHVADPALDADDPAYEPPVDVQARLPTELDGGEEAVTPPAPPPSVDRNVRVPDADIECIVSLQPVRPVSAGAVAAGLHARIGKPLRWFGRRSPDAPWQLLKSDTAGEFSEIVACLLLADRGGAASKALIDAFARLAGSVASSLPAAFVPPDSAREAARAEALDRLCADLDVQIGLTVLKTGGATIAGTRLRGVAEAAGFRLGEGGRFEWVQEDTGAVLYSLANFRPEAFTLEALRSASTPGAVFLLDVPRVADPARVFDQMKLAAKRMAHTLDAVLVDDNRRPLDDAALASIREQVQATAAALTEVNIAPGSPRAMALFGS
ncbi:MAG TPA: cell division protein ZipA C-terminal FtsZ-binding domain-containing protein [Casimicrobiaceae bacterium]|nr:cell division protein ZipA C-terminal FtsZ-binding domain-containing protein [Casimicrobiaceae bacterium]